jgi:cell division septum initiation protein DivIVA
MAASAPVRAADQMRGNNDGAAPVSGPAGRDHDAGPDVTPGSDGDGQVSAEPFEVAVRGYSRRHVDDFAGRARHQVADLEERLFRALDEAERLRAELAAARQPPASRPVHEEVSERIARTFSAASDEARARKDRAAQEITTLLARSQQEADNSRAAAISQARQLLAAAQEHAERAVTGARAEAQTVTGTARAQAEAVTAGALAQAEAALAEAAGRSARLLDEATARAAAIHGGAEDRVGHLAGGRAQAVRQLTEIREIVVSVLEGDTARGSLADEVASAAAAVLATPEPAPPRPSRQGSRRES